MENTKQPVSFDEIVNSSKNPLLLLALLSVLTEDLDEENNKKREQKREQFSEKKPVKKFAKPERPAVTVDQQKKIECLTKELIERDAEIANLKGMIANLQSQLFNERISKGEQKDHWWYTSPYAYDSRITCRGGSAE